MVPPAVPFAEFQRFVATLRTMGQHILTQLTALQQSQEQLAEANAEITALNAQIQAENLRMGAELEVTRKLQQMLLPTAEELQQIADLDIACYMEPPMKSGAITTISCNIMVRSKSALATSPATAWRVAWGW
jgi:serine phosphatase RsbU (regulator of sigma subunit)